MDSLDHRIQQIIDDHHDAFLVELLGVDNCGLPPHRIAELRRKGLLPPDALDWRRQLGQFDPVAIAINLGSLMARLADLQLPELLMAVQHAPLHDVVTRLDREYAHVTPKDTHPSEHSPGTVVIDDHHAPHHKHGHVVVKPPLPEDAQSLAGGEHLGPPRKPPAGVSDDVHRPAYGDGTQRIGMYCRGLGNLWKEASKSWTMETWDGDKLGSTPQSEGREQQLSTIGKVIKQARTEGWTAQSLARALARETGDFSRDWQRIAETELQALVNESVIRSAVARWGDKARVARVPESSACKECLRLFLADGKVIVWDVKDLLANGVNVGKPRPAWKASAYPVHPKCRCGTVSVPPGATVDRHGAIWFSAAVPKT